MLRNYILAQARERAKDKQKRKYIVPQPLKIPYQKNGNAGGSFIRVGSISNGSLLFPAKVVSGGGRVLDNSIFKDALQDRLEDFKKEEKRITKKDQQKKRSSARLTVFEKIILEIKDDFRSGQWGNITVKKLREAYQKLKEEYEQVQRETLFDIGSFLLSFINVTSPNFSVPATQSNRPVIQLIQSLNENQKRGLWKLLNAITVVLGHDSDQSFILQNTNFDVEDPRALFDSLSQSLEVIYTPQNLVPELEKIATNTFEEKKRIKMTDRAVDAAFAKTGRPGAKLSQRSIDNMQGLIDDATLPFTALTDLKAGQPIQGKKPTLPTKRSKPRDTLFTLLWHIISVLLQEQR